MNRIIILSGPIAAGKSTLAADLIQQLPPVTAYVEGDTFWQFLMNGCGFTPAMRREYNGPLMRAMLGASNQFARAGVDVLLDFTIAPDLVPMARKIAREVELHYIVLLPPFEVCAQRARDRSPGSIANYAPYRTFYQLFELADERHIVDDGTPAKKIVKSLAAGDYAVPALA